MKRHRIPMRILVGLLVMGLGAPPGVLGQSSSGSSSRFNHEELAQMLAPIALYPDALLAQIMMGATYPIEVVQADQWVRENPNLKDDRLDAALKDKTWDVSIKSLCHFPKVLEMMSKNLDWTTNLGDAFLAQQAEVMDMIQELRRKAEAEGNLKTTKEQKVVVAGDAVQIEPADPQVIYVPTYNPTVVYGSWWYPAYPPPPIYYPGYYPVAGAAFVGFTTGLIVGSAVTGWCGWNWGNHNVNVNVNRTANFNNVNVQNVTGNWQKWDHNSEHRRNVAYRDSATGQRYGQQSGRSSQERREARGYGEGGLDRQTRQAARGDSGQRADRGQIAANREATGRELQGQGRQGLDRKADQGRVGASTKEAGRRDLGAASGRDRESAFNNAGKGSSERMARDRGRASRSGSFDRASTGGRAGAGGGGVSRGGGGRGGGRR
jgi:hypothetical protein